MIDRDRVKDVVHKNWLLWKLMCCFGFCQARVDVVKEFPTRYRISLGKEYTWPVSYGRLMDIDDNGNAHFFETSNHIFNYIVVQSQHSKKYGVLSFFPTSRMVDMLKCNAALFDILVGMKNGFGWKKDKHLNSFGAIEQLVMKFELEATEKDVQLEDSMLSYIDLLDSLQHPLPF